MSRQLISKINGAEIVTVERDGETFVPIKPICTAIGVDYSAQYNKIQTEEILVSVIAIIATTGADGKTYEMVCLPLKFIYGWIFTINPGKVAPEARESVIRYRRECYDVLYDHFAGKALRQQEQNSIERDLLRRKAAALDSIATLKKAIAENNAEIKEVDGLLDNLQEQRLNPQPSLFD